MLTSREVVEGFLTVAYVRSHSFGRSHSREVMREPVSRVFPLVPATFPFVLPSAVMPFPRLKREGLGLVVVVVDEKLPTPTLHMS